MFLLLSICPLEIPVLKPFTAEMTTGQVFIIFFYIYVLDKLYL